MYLCACKDPQKVLRKIDSLGFEISRKERKEILEQHPGVAIHLYDHNHSPSFLIRFLEPPKRTPTDVAYIAHECQHITYFVFKEIGQGHGIRAKDDEIHAYFLDYLVEHVCKFFWNYNA